MNYKFEIVYGLYMFVTTRCLLTTVDPLKGVKDPEQEPLKTLKTFRTNKEVYGTSPMFGINIAPNNQGKYICVGDPINEII